MKVLVTGGAGYIGSTVVSALLDHGHQPVILDSLVTGRAEFVKERLFYRGDIADNAILEKIFTEHPEIKHCIHFAALIQVPESVEKPFEYYYENVAKSLLLFKNLRRLGCLNVIFSSSASIYDDVPGFMVTETAPLNPRSPYARTKYMMEMILKDFCVAYEMRGIALRYFNPIGADPQTRSGIHAQLPSHVLGKLVAVALGKEPVFKITGVDWDTRDGSGIRDYIHVWDLALAHLKALENFESVFAAPQAQSLPYVVINLGSGRGVTVKELVAAFEKVYGQTINKMEAPPRDGDVAGAYANADRAAELLGWRTQLSIEDGIASALKWGERRKMILPYE
jgi:UDP-glucose 4-epimerase